MKLSCKLLISLAFVCSLGLAALSACAQPAAGEGPSAPSSSTGGQLSARLTLDTQRPVSGLYCEYALEGAGAGGVMVQGPFRPGAVVDLPLLPDPERDIPQSPVPLSLSVWVVERDGSRTSAAQNWQGYALPGQHWDFTLTGSQGEGYALASGEGAPSLSPLANPA